MNKQIERVIVERVTTDIKNKVLVVDIGGEVDSNLPILIITAAYGKRYVRASILLSIVVGDGYQDYINHLSRKIRRELVGY